uniref:Putative secreted peptide n=1 Tax=Anopheles braziliensis TaxID=58242 RepID=A0A2M3ZVJ0_9DIPT
MFIYSYLSFIKFRVCFSVSLSKGTKGREFCIKNVGEQRGIGEYIYITIYVYLFILVHGGFICTQTKRGERNLLQIFSILPPFLPCITQCVAFYHACQVASLSGSFHLLLLLVKLVRKI